jgi:replicative DNA helicase
MAQSIKIPPQNTEAEMALLGSVMIRPESIHEVMDAIETPSFYSEKHKILYTTMLELASKAEPIDLLSLSSRLKEKNAFERIGGGSYLTEIINSVPSSSNILHYARIIEKKKIMRDLIEASEFIGGLGYADEDEVENLLDKAQKKVFDLTNKGNVHKFIEIKETLDSAWERLDRLHKSKDELRGVPTGFKELDNMLSGFQNSDLIILAARPSIGKTSLALDIARKAAINHNMPVGIFSLEMASQQLVDRMLAAEASVNAWHLRTGRLTQESDFERIRDSLERLSKAPIFIDDQTGNTILKMRSVARRLKAEKGLRMLIVDYLQLIIPTNTKNNDNMVQQITEISRALKQLARELDIPVIALSQLSREVEKRGGKPRLSDLRDSGSIEQDADVVMFIHREDRYKEESDKQNIAEILIEKHRNGPVGKVELYFDAEKSTFLSIDRSGHNNDF